MIAVRMLFVTLLYSVWLSGFQVFWSEFVICFNIEFLLKSPKKDFIDHFIELNGCMGHVLFGPCHTYFNRIFCDASMRPKTYFS